MIQSTILPQRYEPEIIDDGHQIPEIRPDGSPQTPVEMMDERVRDIVAAQESLREQRVSMGDAHTRIYQRHLDRKRDSASALGHASRDLTADKNYIAQLQKALDKDDK